MSKVYQTQSIFFALGVLCKLTVYSGGSVNTLSRAKARVHEIEKEYSSDEPVAVGYAAQEIKRIFTQDGVSEATIKLGDTIINIGAKRRIGVRNPFSNDEENFAFLDVNEKSVVTLYRNELKNTLFSRRSNLESVTLIGSDAVQLCKMCCTVIGYMLNEALALLKRSGFEAIIVTKDEQVFTTSGLSRERQLAA